VRMPTAHRNPDDATSRVNAASRGEDVLSAEPPGLGC
jgi:hypothetical protein